MKGEIYRVPAKLTGGTIEDNDHGGYYFAVGLDFGGSGIGSFIGRLDDGDIRAVLELAGVRSSRNIAGRPVWVVFTSDSECDRETIEAAGPSSVRDILRLEPLFPKEGKPFVFREQK